MVYDHIVKHNGVIYKAGEEVPDEASSLPFWSNDVSDDDIVLETAPAKRGRRKKSELQ